MQNHRNLLEFTGMKLICHGTIIRVRYTERVFQRDNPPPRLIDYVILIIIGRREKIHLFNFLFFFFYSQMLPCRKRFLYGRRFSRRLLCLAKHTRVITTDPFTKHGHYKRIHTRYALQPDDIVIRLEFLRDSRAMCFCLRDTRGLASAVNNRGNCAGTVRRLEMTF